MNNQTTLLKDSIKELESISEWRFIYKNGNYIVFNSRHNGNEFAVLTLGMRGLYNGQYNLSDEEVETYLKGAN